MDFLLAEIERKKKQIDQNEVTSNKKYFKRGDLAAKQAQDYSKRQEEKLKAKEEKYGKRESEEDPVTAAIKKKKGDDGKAVTIPREEIQSMDEPTQLSDSLEFLGTPSVSHPFTQEQCSSDSFPACNFVNENFTDTASSLERERDQQILGDPIVEHHEVVSNSDINLSVARAFEKLEKMIMYLSGKIDYRINELNEKVDRLYLLMTSKQTSSGRSSGSPHTASTKPQHQCQQHSCGSLPARTSLELQQKHQQLRPTPQPSLALQPKHHCFDGALSSLEQENHQQACSNGSMLSQSSLEDHQQELSVGPLSRKPSLEQQNHQQFLDRSLLTESSEHEQQLLNSLDEQSSEAPVTNSHELQQRDQLHNLHESQLIPKATAEECEAPSLHVEVLLTQQTSKGHCATIQNTAASSRGHVDAVKPESVVIGGVPGVVMSMCDYEEATKTRHANRCAIALAQKLFGVNTMRESTVTGFCKKSKLDEIVLGAIKVEVLGKYASSKPLEEQEKLWKTCLTSIANKCKDLRYQRDKKSKIELQ